VLSSTNPPRPERATQRDESMGNNNKSRREKCWSPRQSVHRASKQPKSCAVVGKGGRGGTCSHKAHNHTVSCFYETRCLNLLAVPRRARTEGPHGPIRTGESVLIPCPLNHDDRAVTVGTRRAPTKINLCLLHQLGALYHTVRYCILFPGNNVQCVYNVLQLYPRESLSFELRCCPSGFAWLAFNDMNETNKNE
jgi:hypothetical protein